MVGSAVLGDYVQAIGADWMRAEREDWPREKLLVSHYSQMAAANWQGGHRADSHQDYFKDDTLAMIGYGSQGHGQGLNLRDNGLNVIIGVRKNGQSWKEAEQDGWVPGKNLFEIDEAISKGTIIMNMLSDAAQSETWPQIKPQLTKGKVREIRITGAHCSVLSKITS